MTTVELPNNWEPRKYQFGLWDALQNKGIKRGIEIAHRRWGKDDVALHHTCLEAHKRVGTYWHCLPEYAQARKAIWTAVNAHTGKRRIDEAFPEALRVATNDQEMFIRFKNGSTWQVVGSDRYNSLVGAGVAGVVFSEWALANPSAWAYMRPMVEENNGWAVFITTPRGRNHAKSMLDMATKNPRWYSEISTVETTKALSPEQLEEGLQEYISLYGEDLGTAQFEQEYYCSFNAAILGAFYAKEMLAVRNEGRLADIQPIPGKAVHTAWDLGVRDSTAIWWFQVVGDRLFILDFYMAHGTGVEHYAEICHSKPWKRGVDYVPHDAKVKEWGSGRTRVETMRSFELNPSLVPLATKMDGIQAVRQTLPKCVFHTRTDEEGISALEQYRREWDDERKTFKASEVHDWTSHAADAFRYLSQAWRSAPVEAIQDKPKQARGTVYLPGPPVPTSFKRTRV